MASRLDISLAEFEKLDEIANEYIENSVLPTIVSRAKRIVPVDSGDLRDAIHAESSDEGHFVVADTEYAEFVEEGTSKMAAQPYLRPAMSGKLPRPKKKAE